MSLLYNFWRRDISFAYFPHKHVHLTIQNKSVYNPHREAPACEKTQEITVLSLRPGNTTLSQINVHTFTTRYQ